MNYLFEHLQQPNKIGKVISLALQEEKKKKYCNKPNQNKD